MSLVPDFQVKRHLPRVVKVTGFRGGNYIKPTIPTLARPSWSFLFWISAWIDTSEIATGRQLQKATWYKYGNNSWPALEGHSEEAITTYYAELVRSCNMLLRGTVDTASSMKPPAWEIIKVLYGYANQPVVLAKRLEEYWNSLIQLRGGEAAVRKVLNDINAWRFSPQSSISHSRYIREDQTAMRFARLTISDLTFSLEHHPLITALNWDRYLRTLIFLAVPEDIWSSLMFPTSVFESLTPRPGHEPYPPGTYGKDDPGRAKPFYTLAELIAPL